MLYTFRIFFTIFTRSLMSGATEGIKYIYDRFKFAQEFYNSVRHYREGLTELFSYPYKEEVVCRAEISDHYKHRPNNSNTPIFIRLEHKLTIKDQKRMAQEIQNLDAIINILETLLYSANSKNRYPHKKESLLNHSK